MNSDNTDIAAIHLSELALKILPEIKGKSIEERLGQALAIASRIHSKAVVHIKDNRQCNGKRSIQSLINGGQLGRSKSIESVMENRVYPRIPSSRDIEKCRNSFNPLRSDSTKIIADKAVAAAEKSGIPVSKIPATVLGLLGWSITKEEIQDAMVLDWSRGSMEREIIQPSNPPGLDSLSYHLEMAVSEFTHLRNLDTAC